jgi:hypothetical protein
MKTILTGAIFVALLALTACESEPQPKAAVPSADSNAAAAQTPSADATPQPSGVVMPNAAPPVPAYGPTPYRTQPYYFPPTGLGMP